MACALYDKAKVSGKVASQTSKQPDFHGASVTPSGLFPSDLKRPVGSSLEGTWNIFRLIKLICTMSTGLLQPGLARVKEGLGEPGKRLYTACEIHSFHQITIYSRACTSSILSCRSSEIEEDLNRIFQENKMWYPGRIPYYPTHSWLVNIQPLNTHPEVHVVM